MKKPTLSALIVVTALAAASGALAQDAAAGKTSFNKCLACHAIGEGAKNKVGPELNGLDGRQSGTAEGYSYSDANKNSGITWNKDAVPRIHQGPEGEDPRHQDGVRRHQEREERPTISGPMSPSSTRTARRSEANGGSSPVAQERMLPRRRVRLIKPACARSRARPSRSTARSRAAPDHARSSQRALVELLGDRKLLNRLIAITVSSGA